MGKRGFKRVAMMLGLHRHNLRLKAKKSKLLMEQRTDPATPEELSQFAQELICGCALIATPEELSQFALIAELERANRRDNAIRFAQARRRRDNAIQYFLNLSREQVDLSEDDSPVFCDTRYSFSPGY